MTTETGALSEREAMIDAVERALFAQQAPKITHMWDDQRAQAFKFEAEYPGYLESQGLITDIIRDAKTVVDAILALRPPAPESGELEKLREYHKAVEEMTCVWAGTDRASSLHPYSLDECDDDEDRAAWDRFIEARDALKENGNG